MLREPTLEPALSGRVRLVAPVKGAVNGQVMLGM